MRKVVGLIVMTLALVGCAGPENHQSNSDIPKLNIYDDNRVAIKLSHDGHFMTDDVLIWTNDKNYYLAFRLETNDGLAHLVNAKDVTKIKKNFYEVKFYLKNGETKNYKFRRFTASFCKKGKQCVSVSTVGDADWSDGNEIIHAAFQRTLENPTPQGPTAKIYSGREAAGLATFDFSSTIDVLDDASYADLSNKAPAIEQQLDEIQKKRKEESARRIEPILKAQKLAAEKHAAELLSISKLPVGTKDFCSTRTLDTPPGQTGVLIQCQNTSFNSTDEFMRAGWIVVNIMPRPWEQFGMHTIYDFNIEKNR